MGRYNLWSWCKYQSSLIYDKNNCRYEYKAFTWKWQILQILWTLYLKNLLFHGWYFLVRICIVWQRKIWRFNVESCSILEMGNKTFKLANMKRTHAIKIHWGSLRFLSQSHAWIIRRNWVTIWQVKRSIARTMRAGLNQWNSSDASIC